MASSSLIILVFTIIILCYGLVNIEGSHHVYSHLQNKMSTRLSNPEPYRTGYHFQPVKNWINDPNAPMFYKGIYHLFYQYNPNGVLWGPPVWGHSTSTDMINWSPQPLTILPEIPANKYGSWSGSATILPGNKPAILFTGVITPAPQNSQEQDIALPKDPNDPFLKEWYVPKAGNPVMDPTPQNGINASSFRDPTTAWILPDGYWRVLVGNKIGTRGVALLFKSKDFIHWGLSKDALYSYENSGMWECPDFYPVSANGNILGVEDSTFGTGIKHALKVSLDDTKHDVYTIGNYDVKTDRYTPDVGFMNASSLRYDYGKYYASKTFFDGSKKRRILLGWANESSAVEDDAKKGWSGIHTIPRQIWLDKSTKQLIQWPISEIETLRRRPVNVPVKELKGGSSIEVKGVRAVQADVSITFKIKDPSEIEKYDPSWTDPQLLCSQKGASVKGGLGPFGLLTLASKGLEEYTAVFFRVFKADEKLVVLMCSDQSRSSQNPTTDKTTYGTFVDVDPIAEGLSLRTLIDHSVVESFGANGKSVITARAYPTLATFRNVYLYAFNYGSSTVEVSELKAWSMKKAHIA